MTARSPSTLMHDAARSATKEERPTRSQHLLKELLARGIVAPERWEGLSSAARDALKRSRDAEVLLQLLAEHALLTEYQRARVASGMLHGLILGNYRVLDRLGAGSMGIVFKGEHRILRRPVAIKVLPLANHDDSQRLQRFYAEMQTIAQLHHPNIIEALDAGEIGGDEPGVPSMHYFVMEYVPGKDLEESVNEHGPFAPATACDLIYQVASALSEAHKHDLVHRDIKPSNVIVTPQEQAKLLDFGIALQFRSRLTEPGTMLGTIDYLAPEQARDASTVDIRADIYSLGATLYWCLTGQPPFPAKGSLIEDLTFRFTQPPPSARRYRAEIPDELDAVLTRMLAPRPDDRYLAPQAVMRALLPFVQPEPFDTSAPAAAEPLGDGRRALAGATTAASKIHHVLIVDDDDRLRALCKSALQFDGLKCDEAGNGLDGLAAAACKPYDLVLLDVHMPGMNGMDVCRQLREHPPVPHLKVILFSGEASGDDMAQMLMAGADDYLSKPFSLVQLSARVQCALRLKDAQERSDLLNRHLLTVNAQLDRSLTSRDSDLIHARNALFLALAKLAEHRNGESDTHLMRLQRYCRCLGEEAAAASGFASQIDLPYIQMLECCVPLHDIGNVGLPDHILLHPGKLSPDERIIMQSHTIIGSETLQEVAKQHSSALAFLQMAIDIARHHHERWDGAGYPDRLAGSAIPLAARIVAIGDVYDALRSRRVYKPSLSHVIAVQMIAESCQGQFDPSLLAIFQRIAPRFERIFRELQG